MSKKATLFKGFILSQSILATFLLVASPAHSMDSFFKGLELKKEGDAFGKDAAAARIKGEKEKAGADALADASIARTDGAIKRSDAAIASLTERLKNIAGVHAADQAKLDAQRAVLAKEKAEREAKRAAAEAAAAALVPVAPPSPGGIILPPPPHHDTDLEGFQEANTNSNLKVAELSSSSDRSDADLIDSVISAQFSASQSKVDANKASGEDDEFLNNGGWISGFVGSNKDSKIGQKTKFQGGSIGYERFINCYDIVGVAFTKMNINSNSANVNLKSNSHIFSIYTLMSLDDLLFAGYVFGGKNQMKSSRNEAKGKFSAYIYGASASLGYPIKMDNHSLTPMIGLNFYGVNRKAYNEEGSAGKSFSKVSSKSLVGKIAARYSYNIVKEEMSIAPYLSVGVLKDLMLKSSTLRIENVSSDEFNTKSNRKKVVFYARPGLMLKTELFDVGLTYTFEKAKSYTGHVASAKLLVRF